MKMARVNAKRSILIIFIIIISMFITACSRYAYPEEKQKEPEVLEFELVSCYVEVRQTTNVIGRVVDAQKYFHYGFKDGDSVIFKEKRMINTYDYTNYRLRFELTEGEPKIIQEYNSYQVVLTFMLKKDMYDYIQSMNNL